MGKIGFRCGKVADIGKNGFRSVGELQTWVRMGSGHVRN